MQAIPISGANTRRFTCTACGRCCNRGPEIELGEAARLAGTFVTRALFRLHSLPLHIHGRHAKQWWDRQDSPLPLPAALEEARDHLAHFAVRTEIDRATGRSLHLTISALTLDPAPGRCPALDGDLCGIHPDRPLTCRTVPLHYSRPASTLGGYLDSFVGTQGYGCRTDDDALPLLQGGSILDVEALAARDEAIVQAASDRAWKAQIVRVMDNPEEAGAIGLPTYREIRKQSDAGYASLASMLIPWKVAQTAGLLSHDEFTEACRRQRDLLRLQIANCKDPGRFATLQPLLSAYELATPGAMLRRALVSPR